MNVKLTSVQLFVVNTQLQKENINVTEELKSMQDSTENLCSISNKDIGHATK